MALHGDELLLVALIESFADGCSVDQRQEQKQELRKSTAKEGGNWPPQPVNKQPHGSSLDAPEREREPLKAIKNFLLELGVHQTSPTWLKSLEAETVNPEEIGNFLPELGEQQTSLTWLESSEAERLNPEEIWNFLPELGAHQTSLTWLEFSEAERINLEEIFLRELDAQQICLTWLEFPEDETVNPEEIENFLPELGAEHTSLTWLESSEAEIETPKEDIDEIDLPDVNNVQSGVQYIKQLYTFYNKQQHVGRPTDYMRYRTEINAGMRVKLVRALILVHSELHLQPETLYLAVSIMDRFLSLHHVPRTQLHVLGISSLLVATKYEEDWVPKVCKFICVSGAEFSNEELCFYEKAVLNTLDWYLTVPTVYMFLIRFIKAARADEELENKIYYYGRMGLMEYSLILYCPSMVAAATVYAARCTLRMNPLWTDTLQRHTSYPESQSGLIIHGFVPTKLHARA